MQVWEENFTEGTREHLTVALCDDCAARTFPMLPPHLNYYSLDHCTWQVVGPCPECAAMIKHTHPFAEAGFVVVV